MNNNRNNYNGKQTNKIVILFSNCKFLKKLEIKVREIQMVCKKNNNNNKKQKVKMKILKLSYLF